MASAQAFRVLLSVLLLLACFAHVCVAGPPPQVLSGSVDLAASSDPDDTAQSPSNTLFSLPGLGDVWFRCYFIPAYHTYGILWFKASTSVTLVIISGILAPTTVTPSDGHFALFSTGDQFNVGVPYQILDNAGPSFVTLTATIVADQEQQRCRAVGHAILTAAHQVGSLAPAKLWVGLKSSDDVGLRADLQAEVLVNGSVVGTGQLTNVATGSTGFTNALLQTIPLNLAAPVPAGGTLSLRVSARRTCSGGGHAAGTVRLWYNGQPVDAGASRDAGSRFGVTLDGASTQYFLRDNSSLDATAGSSRLFVDKALDSSAACPSRPFVPLGTWSTALP